jgi:hypothetical protein
LRTEVSDLAVAAIARLHDVPLTQLGFPKDSRHARFSFLSEEIGFPVDRPEAREAARKKIQPLIEPYLRKD